MVVASPLLCLIDKEYEQHLQLLTPSCLRKVDELSVSMGVSLARWRSLGGYHTMSNLPDVRVGQELPRRSEKTGKPLPPIQWVWHQGRCCGEITAVPLGVKGHVSKNAGTCPFCGGKR